MSLENSAMNAQRVRLNVYRPGLCQPAHRHSDPHLSLVLDGSLTEGCADAEARVGPGLFAVRSSGFSHQVRFGAKSTLIISLAISREQFDGLQGDDVGRWIAASEILTRNVLASALGHESVTAIEDAVWDILARPVSATNAQPPKWLSSSRDRLIEENSSIETLAHDAGVHRVHFSRAFANAFGAPPTLYRRRLRAIRAAAAAIGGKQAASSAYECGFADQSHMARVLRHMTGASFKRLQSLRRDVTSVQE